MNCRSFVLNAKNEARARKAANGLKSCPLCGAINSTENEECFVCRWAGVFDEDPNVVQLGLDALIDRCPELAEAFVTARRPSFSERLRRLFKRELNIQC